MKNIAHYTPIVLTMLIWGTMGIPSTYAVAELSPLAVLCLRSGIAAVVLFPITHHFHGSVLPDKEEIPLLIILSMVGIVACNYLYFYAVQHTSLTHVAVFYAMGPMITTVLAILILKETAHTGRILGIAVAFLGALLLITGGNLCTLLEDGFQMGDLAELLSSACLAVYSIFSRRLRRTGAYCVSFWLMCISFLVTLPFVFLLEGGFPASISLRCVLSLAYLGILCSGAGYLLQQISIRRIGPSASAAFLNGISPITILTAALILGERITVFQMGCMIAIFAGLLMNTKNSAWHSVVHH